MKSKLQVFISSTYLDLKEERQAAVEAILKSGHLPAGMELFTAGDKSQWEIIQRWINESDIYLLILGGRYGAIEPKSGTSYTELEYDFAVSLKKPYFAVVISDEALEIKVKNLGTAALEKENPTKLKEFRENVLSKISTFFSDTKDVKLAVLESIPKLESEYELKGWVRAETIPDTKALADEIAKLHTENIELRDTVSKLNEKLDKTKKKRPSSDKEFEEIWEILKNKQISITGIKKDLPNASELPETIDALSLAISFRDMLLRGVTNKIDIGEVESFAFFTLCPVLQVHDLVLNEKVPSVRYRRYAITKKGVQFFAYLDRKEFNEGKDIKEPTQNQTKKKR
ncbi:DUF4062 domain-containing protein [Thermodesulfobacteriota bacterium]